MCCPVLPPGFARVQQLDLSRGGGWGLQYRARAATHGTALGAQPYGKGRPHPPVQEYGRRGLGSATPCSPASDQMQPRDYGLALALFAILPLGLLSPANSQECRPDGWCLFYSSVWVKRVSVGRGRYAKTLEASSDNISHVEEVVYDCKEWLSAFNDGLRPFTWRPLISGSVGESIATRVCR